ncbi:hypothetical protein CRE_22715 [Caenorhabditis remanei]|uniref:Protein kinase domain-containing protein n=1 Tax=Caenorhabditis remanei TaxID=31234 RepID=E3NKF4_CAERE|nr:hypothetical protein CRE_22715 [Caenorhabditis remanei]
MVHMDNLLKKGRLSTIEDTVNTYGTETGILSIGERSGINIVDVFEAKTQTHKYKLPPSTLVKDSAGFSNHRIFCLLVFDEEDDTSAVRLVDLRTSMKQSTMIKNTDKTLNSIELVNKDGKIAVSQADGSIKTYDIRNSSKPIDVNKIDDSLTHLNIVSPPKTWISSFLPGTDTNPLYAVNGKHKSSYVSLIEYLSTSQVHTKQSDDELVYKSPRPDVSAYSSEFFLAATGAHLCQQVCNFTLDLKKEYKRLKDANRKQTKKQDSDCQEQTRQRYEMAGIAEGDRGIIDNDVKLDDIVIKEEIGFGTFGQVRVCESKKTGKLFAVKILPNTKAIIAEKHLLEREIAI